MQMLDTALICEHLGAVPPKLITAYSRVDSPPASFEMFTYCQSLNQAGRTGKSECL